MTDFIAAIATAAGRGGVAILRLSGTGSIAAADRLFRPKRGLPLSARPDRHLVYGDIYSAEGSLLDQGLAFVARAPQSYTGEESAELHCHGSPILLSLLLEELYRLGARPATAGEFTKRAFLAGKLDLTQAEAVIDLIDAESPAAAKQAASQLEGALSRRVEAIYTRLVDLMAHFYAVLDYPDEDIDAFRRETIASALQEAQAELQALLQSYQRGRQLRSGLPCVILGKPNVGKSSLLNALSGFERAIVTEQAGTTRDTIEETVTLGGLLLRLVDTAGLRETQDLVEQLGVSRSRAAAEGADLALLVLDPSCPRTQEDEAAIALARCVPNRICVCNKADLPALWESSTLQGFDEICSLSAKEGEGLEALAQAVSRLFPKASPQEGEALLTNARQQGAALRAKDALTRAQEGLCAALPPDLLLLDVEEALSSLGELSGKTLREDITTRIFERFCVGK